MLRTRCIAAAVLFAAAAAAQAASDPADPAMLQLASHSGCLTCHHVEKSAEANAAMPVGPAWEDVAVRYRGQKDAPDQLTRTVLGGSSPYAAHWKGKSSGLAMPPNAVAITPPDARKLVGWILGLEPKR